MGLIGAFFNRWGSGGGGASLSANAASFPVSASPAAIVAGLSDPFAGLGLGTTTYEARGSLPGQLALSGGNVVVGNAAATAGTVYAATILAIAGDGSRVAGARLSFAAQADRPGAPSLTAAAGNGQVTWSLSDGVANGSPITSRILYTGNAPGVEASLGPVTFPYTETGLANGQPRYGYARTANGAGSSDASAEASATPTATLPGATFAMTQLSASNRVYQRASTTGGGQGKGQGTIPVAISVSAPGAIYARRRAADNTILQGPWLVASNVSAGAQTLAVTGVDAPAMSNETTPTAPGDSWHYLDLGDGASNWTNGTVPVAVGGLDAICGQSLAAAMFKRIDTGTNATIAASGLAISNYGRVFACYNNGSVNYTTVANVTWAKPADGGTYDSVFAVAFLNGRIRQTGVMRGLIGHAVSSSPLSSWQGNGANLATWLATVAAAGGSWEGDLLDHGHAAAINGVPSDVYAAMVGYHFKPRDAANSYNGTRTMRLVSSIPNINAAQGTVRQMLAIREGMRQAAALPGVAATLVPQYDIALVDGLHQTQVAGALVGGCIARARHYLRAAGPNGDAGPVPTGATRTGPATIRVTFANPGNDLVLTGAFATRSRVYSAGSTRNVWPIAGVARVDATHLDYTLANDPGPGQTLDFWLFAPLGEGVNDPSAIMLRNDRNEDGIGYGRGAQGNTTPLTAAAITPGGAVNAPPGGNGPEVSRHNLTMTNAAYGAGELLAGFGNPTTGGYGMLAAGAVPMPSTFGIFFSAAALPASGFAALFAASVGATTLYLGVNAAGKLQGWYYNAAGTFVQLTGTTTIATGKLYHAALVVGPTTGGRLYLQNITDGQAGGAREAQSATPPMLLAGEGQIAYCSWITGANVFSGSTFHFSIESAERYTGASYTAPTAPFAGTEAGLVDLYRGADETSAVLSG